MKWKIIGLLIILIVGVAAYSMLVSTEFQPLGRLAFVKVTNPDMYSGSIHSKLAAQYAQERGISNLFNTINIINFHGNIR